MGIPMGIPMMMWIPMMMGIPMEIPMGSPADGRTHRFGPVDLDPWLWTHRFGPIDLDP